MNSRLKTWNSFSKNINNQQIIKGNQLDYTLSQKIYLFDLHYIFQQSQRLICSDKVDFIPKVLHVLFFINRPYIHF